jgi:hypothetical protein
MDRERQTGNHSISALCMVQFLPRSCANDLGDTLFSELANRPYKSSVHFSHTHVD